jgi:pyruvate kinase
VFTNSGSTAQLLTAYRPDVEIIAFTPNPRIVQRMAAYWGVTPRHLPSMNNQDDIVNEVDTILRHEGLVGPGDEVIFLMGTPVGTSVETNMIRFHRITDNHSGQIPQSRW